MAQEIPAFMWAEGGQNATESWARSLEQSSRPAALCRYVFHLLKACSTRLRPGEYESSVAPAASPPHHIGARARPIRSTGIVGAVTSFSQDWQQHEKNPHGGDATEKNPS
jgi:hypothetical protein